MVDIFKYSGRLISKVPPQDSGNTPFGWLLTNHTIESFSEIIQNRLEPVYLWFPGPKFSPCLKTDMKEIKKDLKDNFLMTDEAKKLEQKLKNCRNQCYNCHLCERTFGLPDIDSLIEL